MTKRNVIFFALLMVTALAAIEGTIIATVASSIVTSMGSPELIGLVFSVYLLFSGVFSLLFGKLADSWSKKGTLVSGLIIFSVFSLLCGFANSMTMLIIFRACQGIGAGAIVPVSRAMVGFLFDTKESRAKAQSIESSIWGIAGLVGPFLGGMILNYFSWRFVFFLNVPLTIVAIILLLIFVDEPQKDQAISLDYLGSFYLLAASMALFGSLYTKQLSMIIVLCVITLIGFYLWFRREKKASGNGLVDIQVLKNKHVLKINLLTLTTGMIAAGVNAYLPLWGQEMMQMTPLKAGALLTPFLIFWTCGTVMNTYLIKKMTIKTNLLVGAIFLFLGTLLLNIVVYFPENMMFIVLGLIGIGMGITVSSMMIYLQFNAPKSSLGSVMGMNSFVLMMSKSIGVALLGAVYGKNWTLFGYGNSFNLIFILILFLACQASYLVRKLPQSNV
ncbi:MULTISPECIES: MFS transporter [Vagococcus]|uniref:Drug resistance transporter, EmrB/QacA family n=1 Tax=Vagococcus fluvialis bH819 TaxID=1255619 RepID=A0A1X6WLF4_9ENTE|nr:MULTISPECIES: MFS transporter [Vagococcus]SLM85090.1 drug resistance transporter, EmrB/QacA family [Vagococcus fluvialis bH819]HCM88494.1 MFS transporter [Vagococcus sp.]